MRFVDPAFAQLTAEELRQIDLACFEFEKRRNAGKEASIEDEVAAAPPALQRALEWELLRVELEIACHWDQSPGLDELLQRFPNSAARLQSQWQECLREARGQNEETKANRDDTDPPAKFLPNSPPAKSANFAALAAIPGNQTRFQIIRHLADGGIGSVFVAFDRDLFREVALKKLKRSLQANPAVLARFLAEATTTSGLEHPQIVPIYAVGSLSDGSRFYVMRLIHGRTMREAIQTLHVGAKDAGHVLDFRRDANARDLLLRLISVCRAMAFAHSRGVVHRDLKPTNIMVGDHGETLVVDWGLAKRRDCRDHEKDLSSGLSASSQPLEAAIGSPPQLVAPGDFRTEIDSQIGTPGYMSPEQKRNPAEASERSDIYSLGATLFTMISNRPPNDDLQAAAETRGGARSLLAICRKAMNIDPLERYENADQLASDLEAWLADQAVLAAPDNSVDRMRRSLRRRPALTAAIFSGVVVAVLGMVTAIGILIQGNEALRKSIERESKSARDAAVKERLAKSSAAEAEAQRQRVSQILSGLVTDVERGLENVPSTASIRQRILGRVLAQLESLSQKTAGGSDASMTRVMALTDAGDLFVKFGELGYASQANSKTSPPKAAFAAAKRTYQEAMDLVTSQLTVNSRDEQATAQQATIQFKLATLAQQSGDTSGAMSLFRDSLATRKILASGAPDSLQWALSLAATHDAIGQIHLQNRDMERATAEFKSAFDICSQFESQLESNSDLKRRSAVVASHLGDCAASEGDFGTAEKYYDRDVCWSQDLAKAKPDDLTAQRDWATSCDRLGNMHQSRGKPADALTTYLTARGIREQILNADRSDFQSLHEFFVSCMKTGEVRYATSKTDEARKDFVTASEIADAMAAINPQSTRARRFQSFSAECLTDIALEEGDFDRALTFARKSLQMSVELSQLDPSDFQAERDVFLGHGKVAKVLLFKKDYSKALSEYAIAKRMAESAYARDKTSAGLQDVVYVLTKTSETQLNAGMFAESAATARDAINQLNSIPAPQRADADTRRRFVNLYTLVGSACIENNQLAEARAALATAEQMAEQMITEGQRVEQLKEDLQEVRTLLSRAAGGA